MSKYKVGDKVWCAMVGTRQEQENCPVCFGNRVVHLTLGNDEVVQLACSFCSCGYEGPRGYVLEYKSTPRAELKEISRISTEHTAAGEVNSYFMADGYSFTDEQVFDAEADALAFSTLRSNEYEKEQFEASLRRKQSGQKDRTYSWGAGYHLREAKEHRRKAEYHDKACLVCKERAKKITP